MNKAYVLLLLICSAFFALHKSNSAFTSDEVWSVKAASLDHSAHMAMLTEDVHPPLYYELLLGWIHLVGIGERRIRALSALFYVLSIYAVYRLARQIYGNEAGGLAAVIYMASPLAILSAQFARMYSLLSLLAILSTWLYLQFSIKPSHSKLRFIAYVLINVLGTFTHIGFFFLIFGQFVYHLIFHRRTQLVRLLSALTMSFIPYAFIWGPVLLRQFSKTQEGLAWVNEPTLSTYVELFVVYGGALWLLLPIVLYLRWRNRPEIVGDRGTPPLGRIWFWLLGITVVTPLLISQIKPIFNSRLAIVGLHLFVLGAVAIFGNNRTNYFFAVQLIVLTVIGLIFLHPGFSPCDNRATASFLNTRANDGDAVIFTSLTRLPVDYYLDRAQARKKLFETSFPGEIDLHPGYEGRITDPNRRPELESEARQLVERLAAMHSQSGDRQVFLLRGFHPEIDIILERHLSERFERIAGPVLTCDETSPYFKEVIVFR